MPMDDAVQRKYVEGLEAEIERLRARLGLYPDSGPPDMARPETVETSRAEKRSELAEGSQDICDSIENDARPKVRRHHPHGRAKARRRDLRDFFVVAAKFELPVAGDSLLTAVVVNCRRALDGTFNLRLIGR